MRQSKVNTTLMMGMSENMKILKFLCIKHCIEGVVSYESACCSALTHNITVAVGEATGPSRMEIATGTQSA